MNKHQNIVLVGFMGTGKSAVGRRLASALKYEFVDMDSIIVSREGKPIPRIFAENGEPHFRALERALVKELAAKSRQIIATGGGIVLNPDNINDFSTTSLVVCLTATPEAILKRVEHDTNRPLLAGGDKFQKIKDLLGKRQHLYDAIPNRIDTTGSSIADVTERILQLFGGQSGHK